MDHLKPQKTKSPGLVQKRPSLEPDQNIGMQEAIKPYRDDIESIIPESAIQASSKPLRNQDRYNRDNVRVLLTAIALGLKQGAAGSLIHVQPETISRWKAQHPDFQESLDKAASINKMMLMNFVYAGMTKQPRLALDLLERIHPEDYAPTKRVEQSGSIAHTHGPSQLLQKLHETRQIVDATDQQSVAIEAQPIDNEEAE